MPSKKNDIDLKLLAFNVLSEISDNFEIKKTASMKKFLDNDVEYPDILSKMFYKAYALKIIMALVENKVNIKRVNIDHTFDEEPESYFINLSNDNKDPGVDIEFSNTTPVIRDIIPDRLMKICKYQGNSNICKKYKPEYSELNDRIYRELSNYDKYSEISEDDKNKILYEPFVDLFVDTLSKKRKCAVNLYNHLVTFSSKIVVVPSSTVFDIYDFTNTNNLGDNPSYKLKKISENQISIRFNNGSRVVLTLKSNATNIGKHLSLKYHAALDNMSNIYCTNQVAF